MIEDQALWTIVFFFLGAIIGSFLNVCIVRLPHGKSVVFPSSHCLKCQKNIAWYDNIPLLSYLFLFGKCRNCKAAISFRYFFVELITALSFLLFYQYFGFQIVLLPYLVMLCGFIVATFVDFEHRIIPDEVSMGGAVVGFVFSLFIPQLHGQDAFWKGGLWSLIGLLAGGGSIYVMGLLGNVIIPRSRRHLDEILKEEFFQVMQPLSKERFDGLWKELERCGYLVDKGEIGNVLPSFWEVKRAEDLKFGADFAGLQKKVYKLLRMDTMGGGDVKLMAMVGAFMGWKLALLSFFLAPFFGAIYGMIEKLRTKESTIAYGPFLVLGALISLFKGGEIIRWIASSYGIPY
ncbi:MAG: prepilin peptidase [Candidatus Omnitrophica bacterium]|nr:prepilin peptidase [Candidatus Omnitrophota bacterium]